MRLAIDYLLWLVFTAIFYLFGIEYFPQYDNKDILVMTVTFAWVVAILFVLFWKLRSSTDSSRPSPLPAKDTNNYDDISDFKGGLANHYVGMIADGGFLHFTSDGLFFKPHALNIPNRECRIDFSDIADVQPGPLKNLIIISKNGQKDIFVVNKKNRWVEYIKQKIG